MEKKDLRGLWHHDDAKSAMEEFLKLSEEKFLDKFKELQNKHKNISEMDDLCFDPEQSERVDCSMEDTIDDDDDHSDCSDNE